MTKPYAPLETEQPLATRQHRLWLRRAAVLNAMLLVILLMGLAAVYVFLRLSTAWESATRTGEPVVYQHFFWVNVDPWFAIAYFMVPNGILAEQFARWKFRSTKESSNEEAGC